MPQVQATLLEEIAADIQEAIDTVTNGGHADARLLAASIMNRVQAMSACRASRQESTT